ncbi:MAG: hypothetical protein ACI9BF_000282 [Candidatus Paceibacteria bacterium]|jgi:hypothetical protein
MPRLSRVDIGDEIYHVINRTAGRHQIFSKPIDYKLFEDVVLEAKDLTGMSNYGVLVSVDREGNSN